VVPPVVSSGVNVTGVGIGANLDAVLGNYVGLDFAAVVSVILNGVVLDVGNNILEDCDVYPGDNPINGDLKFKIDLYGGATPDIILMEIF
jgi:hypothetical protein